MFFAYMMASNNSEIPTSSQHETLSSSTAPLKLFFSFVALIRQVFHAERGLLRRASLRVTYRPLSPLAFVPSRMHWSSLMCTLPSGPTGCLFFHLFACTHARAHMQSAHERTHSNIHLLIWAANWEAGCSCKAVANQQVQDFYWGDEIHWGSLNAFNLDVKCDMCHLVLVDLFKSVSRETPWTTVKMEDDGVDDTLAISLSKTYFIYSETKWQRVQAIESKSYFVTSQRNKKELLSRTVSLGSEQRPGVHNVPNMHNTKHQGLTHLNAMHSLSKQLLTPLAFR